MFDCLVLDSDNTELLKKCGTGLPDKIISKGNTLTVKFKTDYSVGAKVRQRLSQMSSCNNNVYFNFKGFRATWKEVTSTGNLAEGAIKSPNFPNDYPNNKDQVNFTKPESIFTLFYRKGVGSLRS